MSKSFPLQAQPAVKSYVFLLLWIDINLAVWSLWVGFATIPLAIPYIANSIQSYDLFIYTFLFLIGGGMGLLQWLLLRQQFFVVWYEWIISSTVGFALGLHALIWAALQDLYIVFSPPNAPILEWDPLLGGALLGLTLGLCQCIAWRYRVLRMLAWIAANVVGWSLGMFLPQLTAYLLHSRNTSWLDLLFPAAFAAVITGLALVWFMGGENDLDKQA